MTLTRTVAISSLATFLLACNNRPNAAPDYVAKDPIVVNADAPTPAPAPISNDSGPLRILSYNVLRYGSGCQDDNGTLHGYLRTIIRYTNPDVAGLLKVDAIKRSTGDKSGDAPIGFADSILNKGLNAAFPGRYAVAPFTNKAEANNINLLFYNKQKLGYAGMVTLASDETDFNLFRLYLRTSVQPGKPDTTFIFFILNHTESGDKSTDRDRQMASVLTALKQHFPQQLPNIIDMGDFNLRNTSEPGYALLTQQAPPPYRFADPPFALDHALKYPADWEEDADEYARYLTTSTRKKEDKPNTCGTGGGAKFWYDHILLSPTIASGSKGLRYVPHSFKVVGNDGNRTGRSVNADKHPNAAVPGNIAEALFQLSNKYPVMLEVDPGGK